MEIYIWLGLTALSLIVEFTTSEMVSIWFVGGGIVSMLLASLKVPLYIQIPAFIIVSVVLMLCFRKIVMKKLNKNASKTNADSAFDNDYTLLTDITFGTPGTIKINGVIWNVVTENENDTVKAGTIVKVKNIKGNKYIVEVK